MMETANRIEFERPDLPSLCQEYTVFDLHFHTNHSDGMNSVPEVADRARELGIGLAVTDHNQIRGAVEIQRYPDLMTIPGIEVTSAEGSHLLVYFYDMEGLLRFYQEDVVPFRGLDVMSSIALPMEAIIIRARAYRSLVIFPHPYCAAYTGVCNLQFSKQRRNQLFEMTDGVEVINAGNMSKWNLQSAVLGFNLGKAITGGSDGHAINHMGRAVTYASCRKEATAFLDAVKHGQTRVVGKEMAFLRKVTTNGLKLRTNIRNCPDLMGKNIRYSYSVINSKSQTLKENVRRSLSGKMRKNGWWQGL